MSTTTRRRSRKPLVADARTWFEPDTEENLVRETLESLMLLDDPDAWLRRLALLADRLPLERAEAKYCKQKHNEERS